MADFLPLPECPPSELNIILSRVEPWMFEYGGGDLCPDFISTVNNVCFHECPYHSPLLYIVKTNYDKIKYLLNRMGYEAPFDLTNRKELKELLNFKNFPSYSKLHSRDKTYTQVHYLKDFKIYTDNGLLPATYMRASLVFKDSVARIFYGFEKQLIGYSALLMGVRESINKHNMHTERINAHTDKFLRPYETGPEGFMFLYTSVMDVLNASGLPGWALRNLKTALDSLKTFCSATIPYFRPETQPDKSSILNLSQEERLEEESLVNIFSDSLKEINSSK